MILVYTHKITSRLTFAFGHLFKNILGVEVRYTNNWENFEMHKGFKMSYSKQSLGTGFHVRSHGLLHDQGIEHLEIKPMDWEGVPAFFSTTKDSHLPFDVFAASFYILSRYEEYLPHRRDPLGRLEAHESLAAQHGFLHRPIVDAWSLKLKAALLKTFPNMAFPNRTARFETLMEIPVLYNYKHKGLLSALWGLGHDLYKLQFGAVVQRFLVWLGLGTDPYDNFNTWLSWHQQKGLKTQFFALYTTFGAYDQNNNIFSRRFKERLKALADFTQVSLLASHQSVGQEVVLEKDIKNLQKLLHRPVKKVRQHLLNLQYPTVYKSFVEFDFEADYSMQFYDRAGFRAGTCTPFYFYDLENETLTKLKLHPVAFSSSHLLNQPNDRQALHLVHEIWNEIQKVEGCCLSSWNNAHLVVHNQRDLMKLLNKLHL